MALAVKIQKQPGFLSRPVGIIIAILVITVLWGLKAFSPTMLALGVIIIFMLMGLNRPVWAIGALIVQQLTVTSFMIPTPFGFDISLRLVILILVGLLLWRSYRRKLFDLGPKARLAILLVVALIIIALVSNFINSGFDFAYKDFRDMVCGLMIICFIPAAVRNTHDLKIFCGIAFIGITASALVGLLQHFNILGMRSATLIPGLSSLEGGDFRVPGLSETELELSYILPCGFLILACVFLLKGLHPGLRRNIPAVMLIMAAAIYFTYTRSALIAIGAGLLALILFIKTRIRGEVILIVMLLIGGFLVVSPLGDQYVAGRSTDEQENSTVSRQILWQAGLHIALANPVIGIGGENFIAESTQYQSSVDPSLLAYEKRVYWSYRTLGHEPPHNDYLYMWDSYGTLAFIIFIGLFIIFIRNFLHSYQVSGNNFIKGLSLGLACALIGYGINAFYHNALATVSFFWILGGLSLAVSKLALNRAGKR